MICKKTGILSAISLTILLANGCSSSSSPESGLVHEAPWGKSQHLKNADVFLIPQSAVAHSTSAPPNWLKLKAEMSLREVEALVGPVERGGAWRLEFSDARTSQSTQVRYIQGAYFLVFKRDLNLLQLRDWGIQTPEKL